MSTPEPTQATTLAPTDFPTFPPTTAAPVAGAKFRFGAVLPTCVCATAPTGQPSAAPTNVPTYAPSDTFVFAVPTAVPTRQPTASPYVPGLFAQYWPWPQRVVLPTDYCALGTAAESRIVSRVNDAALQGLTLSSNFAARFLGFINIPTAGQWWFSITSDDGARVYLNNALILDNDGTLHTATAAVSVGPITLPAGLVPLRVEYFQFLALSSISLNWAAAGVPSANVPASALFYDSTNGSVPLCPPSAAPTNAPTGTPSAAPTAEPTDATGGPTSVPTALPTVRTPRLTYHGGPIVPNAQIQAVFWGATVSLQVRREAIARLGSRAPS
jgi:hypothetical protein